MKKVRFMPKSKLTDEEKTFQKDPGISSNNRCSVALMLRRQTAGNICSQQK